MKDRFFAQTVKCIALGVIALLILIALFLWFKAQPAFEKFGFSFFVSSHWDPVQDQYGALPVIFGTVVSSCIAVLLSAPLSIGAALFLVELSPQKLAHILGFFIQMLAAIPSVVYGLWGIFVLAPWLRTVVEPWLHRYFGFLPFFQGPAYGVGMLAAGVILAIMIAPTICSISREVFYTISQTQREAALALGATRWEMIKIAVLKSSKTGIIGAVILGLGRALGETMAVTMVIGNRSEISASVFSPAQTMASVIANEYAEATSDMHLSALAAIGFSLFLVTFILNSFVRLFLLRTSGRPNE